MSELEWIDRTETSSRVSMWRTVEGKHYESPHPQHAGDEEVSWRVDVTESGTVLGDFPEFGIVIHENGGLTVTRIEERLVTRR